MTEPDASSPSHRARLEAIVAAYIDSLATDRPLDRRELLARHPELAAELERFFEDYDRLACLKGADRNRTTRGSIRLDPGTRLGDYEICEEIGRGGMGVVFRARQPSLDRVVALKLILAGRLAGDEDVRRFRREAEAAARLEHRNIVPIYEVGEHDGLQYFSMRLIEGGSLAQCRSRYTHDARSAAALLETLSRAVHFAHERGVLHRDLKPANVLIDRGGEPYVTDFGLAKRLSGDASLTRSGAIFGTPSYVAPEQLEGGARQVTVATDVYSLGAILYELLAERPPFEGDTSLEILDQVRTRDAVPPTRLRPAVPVDLETVCLRCLEKDPRRRYQSAAELADDLRRFQEGRPVAARPVTAAGRAWRLCRRNPVVSSLAAGILVSIVALTIVLLVANVRLREAFIRTEDALWTSKLEQARARRMTGEVGHRLESLRVLGEAATIRFDPRLREEAIASLGLVDVEPLRTVDLFPEGVQDRHWTFDRIPVDIDGSLRRYARGKADGAVEVGWLDSEDRLTLPGRGYPVRRVRFSPDGRFLVLRHGDSRLRVWELERPEAPTIEVPGVGPTEPWDFRPDGLEMALGLADGSVSVYNLSSGEVTESLRFDPERKKIRHVRYRPDGEALAVLTTDGRALQLWDLVTGTRRHVRFLTTPSSDLDWRHGGVYLAASDGGIVFFFDTRSGSFRRLFRHTGDVTRFGFDPGGSLLVSDSWDNTMRVWDVASGDQILRIDNQRFLRFSADGRSLASIRVGGEVTIWRFHRSSFSFSLGSYFAFLTAARMGTTPDGAILAVSFNWGELVLLDPATGHTLGELWTGRRTTPLFLPRGDGLITWGGRGLHRWPIQARESGEGATQIGPPISLGVGPSSDWGHAALSADGNTVAFVLDRDRVRVFDVRSPGDQQELEAPGGVVTVALSPDARLVAAGGHEAGTVRIWSHPEGEVVRDLPPNQNIWIDFTPDGHHLITGSASEFAYWDVDSWDVTRRIPKEVFGHSVAAVSRRSLLLPNPLVPIPGPSFQLQFFLETG